VYFLPANGWEKVIKIGRFSNETAIYSKNHLETCCYLRPPRLRSCLKIVEISFFPPAIGGGKRELQLFGPTTPPRAVEKIKMLLSKLNVIFY
jgi:hypothetical protein